MLRFKNGDLRLVLEEAKANGCKILLVKDHGVYMMSAIGEKDDRGTHKRLAYAIGCNPNVDDSDAWWDTARLEFGGDDFVERFDVTDPVFEAILNGTDDLLVSATETHIQLETAAPLSPT
ncbi:hypothetical protein GCM10011487_11510 [Steroidobacter agaridevorans]|uniref:DUF3085 domain-containing protein n=1 Tax=Steroidobacter agaridevorans TaxID=2695856 RepID=A0A829Y814_9GAMM|nr:MULTISPECIES: DUF3085 domain-containing protein [Steroidobacteraceae]GFE79151.1 hypothetical protein GCM10011487_11510 [Steroidobacter agaridevorans]